MAAAVVPDETLIHLMAADLERMKSASKEQTHAAEKLQRDEARLNIMLTLAQEQLDRGKEHQQHLQSQLHESRAANDALLIDAERLNRRIESLEADLAVNSKLLSSTKLDMKAQLEAKQVQQDLLQGTTDRLRAELLAAKSAAVTQKTEHDKLQREAYEARVTLEVRLKTLTEELEFATTTRDREGKAALEREYDLKRTVATLKSQHEILSKRLEDERVAATRQAAEERAELEALRLSTARAEAMVKASDRDSFERIQRLTLELAMVRERAEKDHFAAEARERALNQQNAKLIADLKVAQAEINSMADQDAAGHRTSLETLVQLQTAKDTLTTKVDRLEREILAISAKAREREVHLATESEVLRQQLAETQRDKSAEVAKVRDEHLRCQAELAANHKVLAATEKRCVAIQEAADEHATESAKATAALRAEIEGYQATVAKLETHIRENYTSRVLQDEIDSLKVQNARLAKQLTHANSSLASLRIDADLSEQYRQKQLQDQLQAAHAKIGLLERERRFARPLLRDLVDTCTRPSASSPSAGEAGQLVATEGSGPSGHSGGAGSSLLDPALERDLDLFVRQFGTL